RHAAHPGGAWPAPAPAMRPDRGRTRAGGARRVPRLCRGRGRLVTAVLMDKDGTLVEDVPYNVDPARIRLAPGAPAALRRLGRAGYPIVVVSNQSGVARGLFPESALAGVREHLERVLARYG